MSSTPLPVESVRHTFINQFVSALRNESSLAAENAERENQKENEEDGNGSASARESAVVPTDEECVIQDSKAGGLRFYTEKYRRANDPTMKIFLARSVPSRNVKSTLKIMPENEILAAALSGDLVTLQGLHEVNPKKYKLIARGRDKTTAAFHATRNGDLEMIKYLHKHRCVPKTASCVGCGLEYQCCQDGRTLVHIAAECGHLHVLKYFFQHFRQKAFFLKDNSGSTLVMYAVLYKRLSVLKWCSRVLSGIFPTIMKEKDNNGVTPLAMAKELANNEECITYLERALRPEGEFHMKRENKRELAFRLNLKVKYLRAIETVQKHWRGYKGRQLATKRKKEWMRKKGLRLGMSAGLARAMYS